MVTKDPPTPAATVGSPLTLKCFANDCMEDEFTFTWRFNGQQVDSSLVTSIGSNATQLTVDSVATADFGTYTCLVTNTVGTTTGTFTVMEAGTSVRVHCTQPCTWPKLLTHCFSITLSMSSPIVVAISNLCTLHSVADSLRFAWLCRP